MLHNSRFRTFVWYSGVGLLVLLAVAVSLFRLAFSSVEEYRTQLETLAGGYLGQPVTISGINAKVVGISPTVILTDVDLLHKESTELLTRFAAIDIALDPIASLRNLRPIIELTISGANLEVTRHRDGSFGVQGLELTAAGARVDKGDSTKDSLGEESNALGSWFLSQSRLAVRDSRISLHNEQSDERFNFDNVALELRNESQRHRLNASVQLPKSIGKELRLAIDIEGNLLQRQEWTGSLYVKSEALHPQQWLQQLSWQQSSLREGVLDLELWSRWQGGQLESVYSRLQATELLLARGEQTQRIHRLATDARLLHEGSDWQLDLANLQLAHDNIPTQPMQLTLHQSGAELTLQANQLQLGALSALLPYLPQLDEHSRTMLRQMAPVGVVEELNLRRSPDNRIEVQGVLTGLGIKSWEKLPGINGLNASFRFNGDDGQLSLAGGKGALVYPRLFRHPLVFDRLNGEFALHREADGWQLSAPAIAIENSNVSAQLALELLLARDSAPWLGLQGRYSARDAREVPRYLPAGILKEKSLYWLDNAFKAGRVPNGTVQYHGYLNQFPFRDNQGRFEILFEAEGVGLHYQDGWPELQQLRGEVHFDGPGMWVAARSGKLFDAKLAATAVSIEDFAMPRLLIEGGAKLPAADGLRFLRESPLSKQTGRILETMKAGGDAAMALQLAIPLSPTVAQTLPLSIQGRLDFNDDALEIRQGLHLKGLTGTLRFTQTTFSADQLQGELFDKPVSLVVLTDQGDKPQVIIAARGRGDIPGLRQAFPLPLFDYLEGESAWQASLSLPRGVAAAAEGVVLRVSSQLEGIGSALPPPLHKEAASSGDLSVTLYLSGERSGEGQVTMDEHLGVVWRQGERGLRRAQLRLGGGEALSLPGHDVIEVVGSGGKLPLQRWREVLRQLRATNEKEGEAAAPPLPVVVKLKQLQLLSKAESAPTDPAAAPDESPKVADLPSLSFEVKEFSYDDLPLGNVVVKLVAQGQRMSIKELRIDASHFVLTGTGTWTEGGNTFFNLQLDASNLGGMMKRLGFASMINGGEAHVTGKVWWAGSPIAISLAGLNAQLGVSVKEGVITEVDPGAGRMLGILSIPALPKRLFLDFSDVFKEGFAFETIKGDIRIEQGQAYTSNLRLESVPASILISGRTGLVDQDFDQEVYVVPNVSDTVSVASALAWGPQVAAVVALLQEVFKSDIKAATMTRYHISGDWQNPKIRRVQEQHETQTDNEADGYFLQ